MIIKNYAEYIFMSAMKYLVDTFSHFAVSRYCKFLVFDFVYSHFRSLIFFKYIFKILK